MNINELSCLSLKGDTKGFQQQELNGPNPNNTNLSQYLKMTNDRTNNINKILFKKIVIEKTQFSIVKPWRNHRKKCV